MGAPAGSVVRVYRDLGNGQRKLVRIQPHINGVFLEPLELEEDEFVLVSIPLPDGGAQISPLKFPDGIAAMSWGTEAPDV